RRAASERAPFTHFERPFVWLVARAPGATLIAGGLLTVGALFVGGRYLKNGPLEYDMRHLQSDHATTGELYRVSHLADRIRGAGSASGMVVLTNDPADTPVLAETLRKRRDRSP